MCDHDLDLLTFDVTVVANYQIALLRRRWKLEGPVSRTTQIGDRHAENHRARRGQIGRRILRVTNKGAAVGALARAHAEQHRRNVPGNAHHEERQVAGAEQAVRQFHEVGSAGAADAIVSAVLAVLDAGPADDTVDQPEQLLSKEPVPEAARRVTGSRLGSRPNW